MNLLNEYKLKLTGVRIDTSKLNCQRLVKKIKNSNAGIFYI